MGRRPVDMFKSRLVDMLILLMDGVVGILGGYFGRSKTLSTVNDCNYLDSNRCSKDDSVRCV